MDVWKQQRWEHSHLSWSDLERVIILKNSLKYNNKAWIDLYIYCIIFKSSILPQFTLNCNLTYIWHTQLKTFTFFFKCVDVCPGIYPNLCFWDIIFHTYIYPFTFWDQLICVCFISKAGLKSFVHKVLSSSLALEERQQRKKTTWFP